MTGSLLQTLPRKGADAAYSRPEGKPRQQTAARLLVRKMQERKRPGRKAWHRKGLRRKEQLHKIARRKEPA